MDPRKLIEVLTRHVLRNGPSDPVASYAEGIIWEHSVLTVSEVTPFGMHLLGQGPAADLPPEQKWEIKQTFNDRNHFDVSQSDRLGLTLVPEGPGFDAHVILRPVSWSTDDSRHWAGQLTLSTRRLL